MLSFYNHDRHVCLVDSCWVHSPKHALLYVGSTTLGLCLIILTPNTSSEGDPYIQLPSHLQAIKREDLMTLVLGFRGSTGI